MKNKVREEITQSFINALQENIIPWEKQWIGGERAFNPVTGTKYRGTNAFWLAYISQMQQYDDPRWCTFNQAKEKGWKIKSGSKGTRIEFFSPYDREEKKKISWGRVKELQEQLSPEEFKLRISYPSSTYTVFNAKQIEGIPEYEIKKEEWNKDKVIATRDTLFKNMELSFYEGGDQAFYRPSNDSITLPPIDNFKSEYGYLATMLHESAHATGAEKRLNRDLRNTFGTEDYAREELRAEIASAFTAQEIGLSNADMEHTDNHKAYVQNWISVLQNDPAELFRAIKDAELISDYLIEKGEFDISMEKAAENEKTVKGKQSFEQRTYDFEKLEKNLITNAKKKIDRNLQFERDTENCLLDRVQAARLRAGLKGREQSLDDFIKDAKLPSSLKGDLVKVGQITQEYINQGMRVEDIIKNLCDEISVKAVIGDEKYTKNLICSMHSNTIDEYNDLKSLPELYNMKNMASISTKLAERLLCENFKVYISEKDGNMVEINDSETLADLVVEDFYTEKNNLQDALAQSVDVFSIVECKLSENPNFKCQTFYTLKEYDEMLRQEDSYYIKQKNEAMKKYESKEEFLATKDREDKRYINNEMNKYNLRIITASVEESQEIGSGEGGIIEHFANTASLKYLVGTLERAIENEDKFEKYQQKLKEVFKNEEFEVINPAMRIMNDMIPKIKKMKSSDLDYDR